MTALPMVLVPVATLKDRRRLISRSAYERVQSLLQEMVELLTPLLIKEIRPGRLRLEVNRRYEEFVSLKHESIKILSLGLSEASLEKSANLVQESARYLVGLARQQGPEYIPRPASNRFIAALESYAELVKATATPALYGDWMIINTLLRCVGSLIRFDMVSTPLLLTFEGRIREYLPQNLAMLARSADRYMVEVEDAFIAQGLESEASKGELISLHQVRERLGL